jgi:hypothetical protein
MEIQGIPMDWEKALVLETPILIPVKDPGPTEAATADISLGARPFSSSRDLVMGIKDVR